MNEQQVMQIVDWIVAILPSLISIATALGVVIKVVKEFVELKAQYNETKEMDAETVEHIKDQVRVVLEENAKLKQTINEMLTKIDHIDRSKK